MVGIRMEGAALPPLGGGGEGERGIGGGGGGGHMVQRSLPDKGPDFLGTASGEPFPTATLLVAPTDMLGRGAPFSDPTAVDRGRDEVRADAPSDCPGLGATLRRAVSGRGRRDSIGGGALGGTFRMNSNSLGSMSGGALLGAG